MMPIGCLQTSGQCAAPGTKSVDAQIMASSWCWCLVCGATLAARDVSVSSRAVFLPPCLHNEQVAEALEVARAMVAKVVMAIGDIVLFGGDKAGLIRNAARPADRKCASGRPATAEAPQGNDGLRPTPALPRSRPSSRRQATCRGSSRLPLQAQLCSRAAPRWTCVCARTRWPTVVAWAPQRPQSCAPEYRSSPFPALGGRVAPPTSCPGGPFLPDRHRPASSSLGTHRRHERLPLRRTHSPPNEHEPKPSPSSSVGRPS